VFDEIPHSEKVLKRHQNSDDPCIMAWDHYTFDTEKGRMHMEFLQAQVPYPKVITDYKRATFEL
jgi:hypothetical protein